MARSRNKKTGIEEEIEKRIPTTRYNPDYKVGLTAQQVQEHRLHGWVKEMQEGFLHKTVGLQESEEELDLNYCRESYEEELPYALSNSLGFGGHNASILLKKYKEHSNGNL